MKLAVVQTNPVFGEKRSNINDAVQLMEGAHADLYVLPELFNTGYNFIDSNEVNRLAEPVEGEVFKILAPLAKKRACYIVYGFAEKDGENIYNSSALIGPEGMVGMYRKVHLYYRETLFFKPGNVGFPVFDLPFGKVGMMICFDWMFPESARSLALNGAQLIAHPSNLVMPHCPDAMVTRCLENRLFAATANRIGREHRGGIDLTYIGKSEIVTPRGEILTRLHEAETGIATMEIDLRQASDKSINQYNHLLNDRKPEQYGL
jgi:predicted amidohydrolase